MESEVVTGRPSFTQVMKGVARRESKKSEVGSGSVFSDADYMEMFVLGGGTHCIYALCDVAIKCYAQGKSFGCPMAGQCVEVLNDTKNLPYLGTCIKFSCCAMTRNNYQFTGAKASAHPPLEKVWRREQQVECTDECIYLCATCQFFSLCCFKCCCAGKKIEEAPTGRYPFPDKVGVARGTPMHNGITNFDDVVFGNERGTVCDIALNGANRGFSMRVKTGNKSQPDGRNGGQDLFVVARESFLNLAKNCFRCVGMCGIMAAKVGCGITDYSAKDCPGGLCDEEPSANDMVVTDPVTGNVIGKVRGSDQKPVGCARYFRNRCSARDFPIYDILDEKENTRFTLMTPVKFTKSFCTSYYDEDFFVIVPGKLKDAPLTEQPTPWFDNYSNAGWIVSLSPKHETTCQSCVGATKGRFAKCCVCTCGMSLMWKYFVQAAEICFPFCKTCPCDNITQVPHPKGKKDMRCTFPTTHCLSATRTRYPQSGNGFEITDQDRYLLAALNIRMDFDELWKTVAVETPIIA